MHRFSNPFSQVLSGTACCHLAYSPGSYSQEDSYRQSLEKEQEIEKRLNENLTEEQMELMEQYHAAVYGTVSACGLLAYRQGMKDMAIIFMENKAMDSVLFLTYPLLFHLYILKSE